MEDAADVTAIDDKDSTLIADKRWVLDQPIGEEGDKDWWRTKLLYFVEEFYIPLAHGSPLSIEYEYMANVYLSPGIYEQLKFSENDEVLIKEK